MRVVMDEGPDAEGKGDTSAAPGARTHRLFLATAAVTSSSVAAWCGMVQDANSFAVPNQEIADGALVVLVLENNRR